MTSEQRTLGEYIVFSKQKLGAGSFAKVLRGYHKDSGLKVAVKKISTSNLPTKLLNSIESEIATLKSVKHPNILQLLDVYKVSLKNKF
jgi:serine/threonine protein kinase